MTAPQPDWTLVVHGGSGAMTRATKSPERDAAARAALTLALERGGAILRDGGGALDAVEAAVRVLEDDPQFNAGRGAVFTADGTIELDAAIMDGRDRRAGAVAAVRTARNPVTLARAVMERSPHVLLSGAGAEAFAAERGFAAIDPDWFATSHRRAQLDRALADGGAFDAEVKYGTVGAVARDAAGHVAAATSTGGLTAKRWGRIGDSPLIGAGTYADDRAGAVSATGSGEFYIRNAAAHEICARVRLLGESIATAVEAVQAETRALGGAGGIIAVGADGAPVWSFNTPGMFRGVLRAGAAPRVAIYADES